MSRLANFLNKYDTIIFDLDGVITQEQAYWDASALTVYEFLNSDKYYGDKILDGEEVYNRYKNIRAEVFSSDKIISVLKSKGVNSNWDLSYVTFALTMIHGRDYSKALDAAKNLSDNILDEYSALAEKLGKVLQDTDCKRNGKLWMDLRDCFQEWYLGDELFEKIEKRKPNLTGKAGLCFGETPIIDREKLKTIFRLLTEKNVRLCVATGRLLSEAVPALTNFGIIDMIDKNNFIGYEFVRDAEAKTGKNVTKPHPYMFLKALMGADYPDEKLVNEEYPADRIKTALGVGDAAADLFSTHASDMDFCAVLTGVAGKSAKGFFEENKAEYILNSLEDFLVE